MKKLNFDTLFKLGSLFILAFIIFIIYYLNPEFYSKLWILSISGDIDGTVKYLQSFGVWAIVISFILDVLINVAGFLPSIFLSTANGLLFGIPLGILISWSAESVGVILSFFVMRFLLRDFALKIIEKSEKLKNVDEISGKNGFVWMALARTLPYFPSGILTALGAVSKMSVRDYVLATFIGKLPSTSIEVILGHDVVRFNENMERLAIITTGIIVFYLCIFYYQKKKRT